MSVTQPPNDTPFGLEPNVAAGLAYLFGLVGGVVIMLGGGTNKFVQMGRGSIDHAVGALDRYLVGLCTFASRLVCLRFSSFLYTSRCAFSG